VVASGDHNFLECFIFGDENFTTILMDSNYSHQIFMDFAINKITASEEYIHHLKDDVCLEQQAHRGSGPPWGVCSRSFLDIEHLHEVPSRLDVCKRDYSAYGESPPAGRGQARNRRDRHKE
jgi:hypothetical protein